MNLLKTKALIPILCLLLIILKVCSTVHISQHTNQESLIQVESPSASTSNEALEYTDLHEIPISELHLEDYVTTRQMLTREFRQKIGGGMPEYIFELAFLSGDSNYQTIAITIKDAENKEIIQQIIPSEYTFDGENVSCFDNDLGFTIEDMNFDGYADIRIIEFLPAGPNIPHVCWVWDKETRQYIYDSALSSITSLAVDHENELIWTFGCESASEHYTSYYRYIDGVLTLIKELSTSYLDPNDPEQGYLITYELKDDLWLMTDKEKINLDG